MMQEGNPRFKPGDIVTIRAWDDMSAEYGHSVFDRESLVCPCEYGSDGRSTCSFRNKKICGMRMKISEALWLSSFRVYAYYLEGCGDEYYVESMFEETLIQCGAVIADPGSPDELFDFLLKGDGKP